MFPQGRVENVLFQKEGPNVPVFLSILSSVHIPDVNDGHSLILDYNFSG